VLEGIVGPVGVRLFAILVLILVFFVLEVRIGAERASKVLIIRRSSALLLKIVRICRGVLIKVLCVSVLQKLIVCSLIKCRELASLPLLKLLLRPLIALIHVPVLCRFLLISLLLCLILPPIQVEQVFLR
jgi:hypothetical protein